MRRWLSWRAGIGIVGAIMLMILSALLSLTPQSAVTPSEVGTVVTASELASRDALHHCQAEAQPDDLCRQIWAAHRQHFLGTDRGSARPGQP